MVLCLSSFHTNSVQRLLARLHLVELVLILHEDSLPVRRRSEIVEDFAQQLMFINREDLVFGSHLRIVL